MVFTRSRDQQGVNRAPAALLCWDLCHYPAAELIGQCWKWLFTDPHCVTALGCNTSHLETHISIVRNLALTNTDDSLYAIMAPHGSSITTLASRLCNHVGRRQPSRG